MSEEKPKKKRSIGEETLFRAIDTATLRERHRIDVRLLVLAVALVAVALVGAYFYVLIIERRYEAERERLRLGEEIRRAKDLVASVRAQTEQAMNRELARHKVELEGANAVVIGRSGIVGKPVSILLQQRNATVTLCHSRTRDLAGICRQADVLVAATGRPKMVKADWIKPGAAVIDVGVTQVDGALVGDVDFDAIKGIASLLTPSRRGIGPMTITMLLRNTLVAYRARTGK